MNKSTVAEASIQNQISLNTLHQTMNTTIHSINANRRRRLQTNIAKRSIWRFPTEYLFVILVLASKQGYGNNWALGAIPDTTAPSMETTLDSSWSNTYLETHVTELSSAPTDSMVFSAAPTDLKEYSHAPTSTPSVKPPRTFLPTVTVEERQDKTPTSSILTGSDLDSLLGSNNTNDDTVVPGNSSISDNATTEVSCNPTDGESCAAAFCKAPPQGCSYKFDHYILSEEGNCCPALCYAVDANGDRCSPNISGTPTAPPTPRPTYKKTMPPTPDPTKSDSSLSPTMVDTTIRQDTPAPGENSNTIPVPATPASDTPTVTPNTTAPDTLYPTEEPTQAEKAEPVTVATPRPTPRPTPDPTQDPTQDPTPRPTKTPTNEPTASPTPKPTRPPTKAPTRPPTDSPTEAPSMEPSVAPTPRPTRFPTQAPVPWPTPLPTPLPSLSPTTARPTPLPTDASTTSEPTIVTPPPSTTTPSASPTNAPSFVPTDSSAPTTRTPRPSVSAPPSGVPSYSPSDLPSTLPTNPPSGFPSFSPTIAPTTFPSDAPSLSLQSSGERVVMTLRYADVLQGLSIIKWEQITATHIRDSIIRAGVQPEMEDLRVWTNIIRQTPELGLNSPETTMVPQATAILGDPTITQRSGSDNLYGLRRRSLQATDLTNFPLEIAFDTAVSYRSKGLYHDIQILISGAFDTDEDRAAYVSTLKRTGDGAFQNLNEVVSVSVGGVDIPVDEEEIDQGRDMTVFIIIGVCSVLGAILLLVAFFLWLRYYGGNKTAEQNPATTRSNSGGNGVTAEIVVEHNPDEVSTLGDPVYTPNGMMMAHMMTTMEREEERTASVGEDYDYKYLKHHNFGANQGDISTKDDMRSRLTSEDMTRESSAKTGSASKLGLSQMGGSIFSDDASFEEQYCEPEQQVPFEVTVPAGKLGMVIDTPHGGFPVVHAIKDTSILADRVRVGDRLVSVDGQDCTTMTAVQVSKLISLKSDQESRVLVFVRNRMAKPRAGE